MVKRPEMPESTFPTAEEDVCAARLTPDNVHTSSPSYRLAYADEEHLALFEFVDSAEEARRIIKAYYKL